MVGICLPWGLWWYRHIPTPGKGGLLLALVATLMPLVWEEVREIGRAGLILTLVILFAVEYRAIDKEHKDYAEDQTRARREEKESFEKLLEKQQAGVEHILSQQARDVEGILDQEQKHFERMFSSSLRAQSDARRDFSALLKQQQGVFDRQYEMIESLNGHLLPGNDPMPTLAELDCTGMPGIDVERDDFIITGTTTNVVGHFPYPILTMRGRVVISIGISQDGLYVLSMDVRKRDGSMLVRLDNNGFEVNPLLFKRHPDKSTLIVEDAFGSEVFYARYANKRLFRVRGKLNIDGQEFDIPYAGVTGGCIGYAGGGSIEVK
jgi:hypothetical protein